MLRKSKLSTVMCIAAAMTLSSCSGTADSSVQTDSESTAGETEAVLSETEASESAEETTAEPETFPADITPEAYEIASLKGPTTMGMVKLMSDSEKGETFNTYNVSIYGAADEIVTGVVSGNTDIANVPANLAAVLYKKTEGAVMVSDVNTLGVLYVVSAGEEISSVADLKGKTVYSTGKGTSPEYVFNYILRQNGLEPQADVIIEYKSEASECAAAIAEAESGIAVLPQPYVTAAQLQNENIKIALSLTDEWDKVSSTPLITGVTIVQRDKAMSNPGAFDTFLDEYASSVDFVNSNTDEAAALIGGYDIVNEPVAKKALPYCNITLMRDNDMRETVKAYWEVLFEADPTSVGGSVPDDSAFYSGSAVTADLA